MYVTRLDYFLLPSCGVSRLLAKPILRHFFSLLDIELKRVFSSSRSLILVSNARENGEELIVFIETEEWNTLCMHVISDEEE
jgi:hypothetical protein